MVLSRANNETVLKARALRRSMTLPEGMLWQVLRQRPEDLKFRRQHPVGRFVADFYCAAARLIIEVDGESHSMGVRPERDLARDAWLTAQRLRVYRVSAREVMSDMAAVVAGIVAASRD